MNENLNHPGEVETMNGDEIKAQVPTPTDLPPQNAAGNKTTETQKIELQSREGDLIAKVIVLLIFFGLPFYFFVWRKLPWGITTKLIVAAIVVFVIVLVYIFFKARTVRVFEVAGNFVIVLFIVLGAAIFSIYFTDKDQTVLFKLFVIGYFSFFPAWLYLQFISIKGKTLWDEYVINLFRLHIDDYSNLPKPPDQSLFINEWRVESQVKTIYEKKFEGLFGPVRSEASSAFAVFRGENLWPVAIATLIISVGWVVVVQPQTIFNVSMMPASYKLSVKPDIPLETFRFAFVGAYFYILQMLVRRYFQNDLKTSAYVNSIMRIIVVILLVWVIDLGLRNIEQAQRSLFAFIVGVFPYVGWQALRALVKLPLKAVVPSLRQPYPLSDLDGLNIWYESRLLEEGIEDMQNLATANLVDVMLNTRIPVERLVDWVDQSLLYLHLGKNKTEGGESNREKLRRFGIRTATDLQDVFEAGHHGSQDYIKKLEYLLNTNKDDPSILRSVLATFKDDPNLFHIREWKSFAKKIKAKGDVLK